MAEQARRGTAGSFFSAFVSPRAYDAEIASISAVAIRAWELAAKSEATAVTHRTLGSPCPCNIRSVKVR